MRLEPETVFQYGDQWFRIAEFEPVENAELIIKANRASAPAHGGEGAGENCRVSQDEIKEMFGENMPFAAAKILFPEKSEPLTPDELRFVLRAIAAWNRRSGEGAGVSEAMEPVWLQNTVAMIEASSLFSLEMRQRCADLVKRAAVAERHEVSSGVVDDIAKIIDPHSFFPYDGGDDLVGEIVRQDLALARSKASRILIALAQPAPAAQKAPSGAVVRPDVLRAANAIRRRLKSPTYTFPTINVNVKEIWAIIETIRALATRAERQPQPQEGTPEDIRAQGWAVAVHNDYRIAGEPHTFWLFTKGDRAIKGEGRSDAEALAEIRAALAAPLPSQKEGE